MRFSSVLTMECDTQDYCVFGLCPSPCIQKNNKEHNVSENESVSVLRYIPPPHLRRKTDPVSETLCSLMLFRRPDDGQIPKTQ
jgi:hypothetical protein